jgi:hypothetical protein
MQLTIYRVHYRWCIFFYAQLVSLPRLSQTIGFSSDHNTRWRLLNPINHTFMINSQHIQNPLDPGSRSTIPHYTHHDKVYEILGDMI